MLEAQAAWSERALEGAGGQAWLRLLPTLDWPMPEPDGRFAAAWTLAPSKGRWSGAWRAESSVLPLATGTVSRIDLRFVLEAMLSPERLLSECARVLCAEGRVLVFGLNPWGAARLRWARHGLRALSRGRAVDLLRAEGLEVIGQRTLGPYWSAQGIEVAPGRTLVESGRVAWAVLATRRQAGLTPIRRTARAWRASPGVPAA